MDALQGQALMAGDLFLAMDDNAHLGSKPNKSVEVRIGY